MLTFLWCMCAFSQVDERHYQYIPSPFHDDDDGVAGETVRLDPLPEQHKEQPKEEPKERERIDSNIRFNDLYGEVNIRPAWEEDDAFEYAELNTIIYLDDLIRTKEESGAILGLENMCTYVIKPCTRLIIYSEEKEVSKLQILIGRITGNIKKMMNGESFGFEMSQCVCGIKGTIFELEELGTESHAWLFTGSMEITSKKTGEVFVMEPGDSVSVGRDGVIRKGTFDIEEKAKEFGVSLDDINERNASADTSYISDALGVVNIIAWICSVLLFAVMIVIIIRVVSKNEMGCSGCIGIVIMIMLLGSFITAVGITVGKDFIVGKVEELIYPHSSPDVASVLHESDGTYKINPTLPTGIRLIGKTI